MNIKTEEELIVFGKRLGEVLEAHTVITLNGNLGAGKTTMTKGIGQGLGVKKIINSPTFTILKVYEGRLPLYHFDAYRLEGTDDDLGFEEIFDDEGVCGIEWAEFIEEILPAERLEISIEKKDDNSRELQFVSKGRKYDKLLEELEIC